ncbi:MAG: helix-turn-helix domain-containing protein [Bryobacteraceae bacterium]
MKTRWYSFGFKKAAVERARGAASIPALSKELGVHYCQLYRWLRVFEEQGEEGLQPRGRKGRPTRIPTAPEPTDPQKRIAELERKIGQQALDLDFLGRAFKRVKESRPNNSGSGTTASTK